MGRARDKLPITHDIFAGKKMQKMFLVSFKYSLFASASYSSSRIVIMRACFFFKSLFCPCFEFEARGIWPICVIKKTLTLNCFSAKV